MFLEDFVDTQNVAYSLICNSFSSNKISHAYLINANNFDKAFDFALALAKGIICLNHKIQVDNKCNLCNICDRIDDGNYPELKIIESDSLIIKKEQLLELQSDFSRTSIEGKYRVYIIRDCDKMNKQSSNSLLKFLEEPVDGIIAILLTNHISNILPTVISRCQVINLVNNFNYSNGSSLINFANVICDNSKDKDNFVVDNDNQDFIDYVISFILYFEENGIDTLVFMKNIWYNKVKSREDFIKAFLLMMYFYYDVLKYKNGLDNYFYCDRLNDIKSVANINSIDSIVHKINVINYGYDMVKYNLNINLLMDDIVIRLGD